MRQRTLLTMFLAAVFTLGSIQLHGVASADTIAPPPDSAASTAPTKGGNGFARALAAPFKAFGRLFGGGKKNKQIQTITAKDIEKFESVATMRVTDARSNPRQPSAGADPSAPGTPTEVTSAAPSSPDEVRPSAHDEAAALAARGADCWQTRALTTPSPRCPAPPRSTRRYLRRTACSP